MLGSGANVQKHLYGTKDIMAQKLFSIILYITYSNSLMLIM